MTELRAYQRELLGRVETALAPDGVRVMMQLPTGGGKTIIAAHLLSDWLRDGRKAVWLTHRKELAEQTRTMLADAHISAMTDIRWNPGTDAPAMSHGVVILMAQTVSRRTARMSVWDEYGGDDLLVIDEAHHATADGWARAMQQWPGRIIGMTATPWRLSKKEGFDKQLIFANAEERLLSLLRSEAEAVGLFPDVGTSEKQRRRVDWKKLYEDLPIRFSATMLVERSGKPIEQVYAAVSRWKGERLISKTDDGYRKIDPSIFRS